MPKLVAFGVFTASIVCLIMMWSLYFTMWLHGETSITVYTDQFSEFWIELLGLTLAVVFLPVLLYETNQILFEQGN